jgi:hypothetical protein
MTTQNNVKSIPPAAAAQMITSNDAGENMESAASSDCSTECVDRRREIAEEVLGCAVDWSAEATGYLECPGFEVHTSPDGPRDCCIYIDGAPTIFCFHQSCAGFISEANSSLRSAIARAEVGKRSPHAQSPRTNPQEGHKNRVPTAMLERAIEKELAAMDVLRAKASLPLIIEQFQTLPARWTAVSPIKIDPDPRSHWRQLLGLYRPDDHVWIGREVYDSSATNAALAEYFRPVAEWLKRDAAPGKFTCPSTFKPGVHSRGNDQVVRRPFLVCESDTLRKHEIGAVFQWLRGIMRLRAVVDTAGKSLHGWFDFPDAPTFEELQVILPALGLDRALFKPSQPCRLPGGVRDGRFQVLLYLDTKGVAA